MLWPLSSATIIDDLLYYTLHISINLRDTTRLDNQAERISPKGITASAVGLENHIRLLWIPLKVYFLDLWIPTFDGRRVLVDEVSHHVHSYHYVQCMELWEGMDIGGGAGADDRFWWQTPQDYSTHNITFPFPIRIIRFILSAVLPSFKQPKERTIHTEYDT